MKLRLVALLVAPVFAAGCSCQKPAACQVDADCGEQMRCDQGACIELGPNGCTEQGAKRPCGTDVGACVSGYQICDGAAWGECTGAVGPSDETCDGLDHDCDGVPNNRDGGCDCTEGTTRPCYKNPLDAGVTGTCSPGVETCVGGKWGTCQGSVEPQPGQCGQPSCAGGPNPGCACVIGQQASCYTGPAATQGVGTCSAGVKTCVATATGSEWGPCVGEQLPEAERCDGVDHDCDGTPSNPAGGCTCIAGTQQSCYSGPAGTERVGQCRSGVQDCVADATGATTWGPCVGEVAPAPGQCAVASCTGPDDPNPGCACIDGQSQHCYSGPSGTENVGACRGSAQTCLDGAWGVCDGEVIPQPADRCVPPGTDYASHAADDLDCDGTLERHDPVVSPKAAAANAAVVTPPAGVAYAIEVAPLVTVTFQGSATDVDGAGSFGYEWRLLSAPAGNTAGLSGAPGGTPSDVSTQANPTLFAQLAGEYVVAARAVDATGCTSAEAKVVVKVKPNSALHLQLTWDAPVDVDLQMVPGENGALFASDACFWGRLSPDWGVVDPTLDIDDVAGCNPENVNFGSINGTTPTPGTKYSVFIHYYCGRRGHRPDSNTPDAVCYEPTTHSGQVNVSLKVFVDGVLATTDDGVTPAEFTRPLNQWDFWKVLTVEYDASGVWRIHPVTTGSLAQAATNCDSASSASCVCSQITNPADPYCGASGAACRQRFP